MRLTSKQKKVLGYGSWAAVMVALSWGCEPLDEGIDFDNDPSCEGEPAPVGGRWTLSGTGSRSSCEEETLNADSFTLSSGALDVRQDGASLLLGRQIEGFALTGTVRGSCVEFQTVEGSGLGSITYRWEGKVQSDGSL